MKWLLKKITDRTEGEYEAIYQSLSASRKAHIDRLQKQDDKKRSLLATKIVSELLSTDNSILETDTDGRPYLRESAYFVSISHSGEAVACAVSEEPVGIDVEKIKPVRRALVNYVCLPGELEFVLPPEEELITDAQTLHRFFAIWTAKEACFKKAGGSMLQIDTLSLDRTTAILDGYFVTIL